jgi:hypothetical protein
MENNSFEKDAKELMQKPGRTKGSELITFANYIRDLKGEEGLRAVEKKMAEAGCPFRFDEVKEMGQWYPEYVNVLAILTAKHVFNWSKEDVFNFGYNSPKYSFLLKIFVKYFTSFKMVFEGAPKYWRKFLDVGEIEATEFNEEKKYLILQLRDYMFHPIMCDYFAGYFLKIAENSVKSQKVKIEEVKCSYRGDPYHEYFISWE